VTRQTGTQVVYRDLPVAEYKAVLVGAGVPEAFAGILADTDAAIAKGALDTDTGDLRRLIGRPTTPLVDAVAAALEHEPSD
jgi:NAD(P)H dehydrogenase (quinone)